MLSDESVKALCAEHGFVFGMRERRLVRAVEAVVRADQIEKDAALINSEVALVGSEYFDSDGIAEEWTMHKRKTWANGADEIAKRSLAAIRAQLEGTTDE